MEARSGRVTLNTQNGGSYSRIRVIMIDVAIDDRENIDIGLRGHITSLETIAQQDGVRAGAETELHPHS